VVRLAALDGDESDEEGAELDACDAVSTLLFELGQLTELQVSFRISDTCTMHECWLAGCTLMCACLCSDLGPTS
jgi:hypothetical protein